MFDEYFQQCVTNNISTKANVQVYKTNICKLMAPFQGSTMLNLLKILSIYAIVRVSANENLEKVETMKKPI